MKRLLPATVLGVTALTLAFGCSPSRGSYPITVAYAPFESVGLVYIAQDRDLFADEGVDITLREYATGVAALDAVMEGEADLAVGTAEYPLVRQAFSDAPISAIACIDRPDFVYVIGRKDRGVRGPSDLAGKRVGTTAGSIAQFYLGRFLELNQLTAEDVEFVDLRTPEEWRAAISDGEVDAVVLAQPEASLVADRLGSNATFFSVQGGQPAYALAIATNEWIAENPASVSAFLSGLAEAEQYMAEQPTRSREIIQQRLGVDPDYMDLVESQNAFGLSLDGSLILAMEDEARWMIRSGLTSATAVPDFGAYIHLDGLEQARPDAVNILR